MNTFKVTVLAELDGVPVAGFPLVRRLMVDEVQSFGVEQASGAGYIAVPADLLATIQALILRSDQTVTLRLDGQTDAGLVVNPGGLVVLMDVTIDAGAGALNAKVENTSGVTVNLAGVAGGT